MRKRAGHLKLGAFLHPTDIISRRGGCPRPMPARTSISNSTSISRDRRARQVRHAVPCGFCRDAELAAGTLEPRRDLCGRLRADHAPVSAVVGHQPHRARRHGDDDLQRPFHVARKFASLDHISGGRAGWNLVTSVNIAEAYNFGREQHPEHDARYDRGTEFARIVVACGIVGKTTRSCATRKAAAFSTQRRFIHSTTRANRFSVRGPLNVPRSPAGTANHGAGGDFRCRAGAVGGSG